MTPFPSHAPGDLVAVGDAGARTFADLRRDAGAIAAALAGRPEAEIVLACEDRYLFAACLLGAWSAGRRVVLPPNTQAATLDGLARAHGRLLVHDRPGEPDGQDAGRWLGGPAPAPLELPAGDLDVVLVATSGSTGPSQLVPKTLAQLLGEVAVHQRLFAIGPEARLLVMAPPQHIYGLLFGILLPLRAGAALVRQTALHAEAVIQLIRTWGVTHLVSVPAQLRALAEAGPLPPVRRVFSSGSALPAETSTRLAEAGWQVTEIFGSSETGGVAWREPGGGPWRALPGVEVAVGPDGHLAVDGPFLHPAQSRPYLTADLARLTAGGFELLGRSDGVVKAGGKRVSLREIEERALGVAGVSDAAALCVEVGGARGQEVWLAVAGRGVTTAALRRELATWLDPLALPRRLRVVETLPREATGKLPRARLMAMFGRPAAPGRFVPTSEVAGLDPDGNALVTLTFEVPPDLVWFEGHFPGRSVLAGVVQLQELVLRHARRRWPRLGAPRRVLRLKFKKVIEPGDRISLRLRRQPDSPRVLFDLSTDRGDCASGTVVFDPQPLEARP